MKSSTSHIIKAITLCVMLSSCAPYATVTEKRPKFRPVRSTLGAISAVEQGIVNGLKASRRDPMAALGGLPHRCRGCISATLSHA